MKTNLLVLTAITLFAGSPAAFAQIVIPSDGSDGALTVAANQQVQIDLSQAVTGTWNANNAANAGKGIFDQGKRAVVFKYSSVTIGSGAAVTFKNHPNRPPVVWLVQGDVTIAGTLSLNASNGSNVNLLAEPGPGGFRGGAAGDLGRGTGLGIGGGNGVAGAYASKYGNSAIIPLIGGSGGYGGGGGGGAILIAAPNSITVSGIITAYGGGASVFGTYGGSGGAIKLVANSINGSGTLDVRDDGRIRLEANTPAVAMVTKPATVVVPPAFPEPILWQADNAPTVKITKVDTVNSPANPIARLDTTADINITANAAQVVTIQTTNFPTNGIVQVRAAGKVSPSAVLVDATLAGGSEAQATWTATVNFPAGFTTLQARATVP